MSRRVPKEKVQTGTLSKDVFETLAGAFESHICIIKLNGILVKFGWDSTMTHGAASQKLLGRLLCHSAIELLSKKGRKVEKRRVLWTNFKNLKSWINNWSKDLVELEFAHLVDGEVIIPQDQLCKIININ